MPQDDAFQEWWETATVESNTGERILIRSLYGGNATAHAAELAFRAGWQAASEADYQQ